MDTSRSIDQWLAAWATAIITQMNRIKDILNIDYWYRTECNFMHRIKPDSIKTYGCLKINRCIRQLIVFFQCGLPSMCGKNGEMPKLLAYAITKRKIWLRVLFIINSSCKSHIAINYSGMRYQECIILTRTINWCILFWLYLQCVLTL